MSKWIGDFLRSKTVMLPFNTVALSTGIPTTLSSGAVIISKNGVDVTPSGGVTLGIDVGSVTGRHRVTIDTSVDAATFTPGSDYVVRLSGSSNVGGTSLVGMIVGIFSIENRSTLVDASGRVQVQSGTGTGQVNLSSGNVSLTLTQALSTGETGDTVGGALLAARADGFGKWVINGTPGQAGATLVLYAADGTTIVRTFDISTDGVRT